MAGAHCWLAASFSAGNLCAFFLLVFLCCGNRSFPLAAPAFSGGVPPAAKGKSRISRAHCRKRPPKKHREHKQREKEIPLHRIEVTAAGKSMRYHLGHSSASRRAEGKADAQATGYGAISAEGRPRPPAQNTASHLLTRAASSDRPQRTNTPPTHFSASEWKKKKEKLPEVVFSFFQDNAFKHLSTAPPR